MPSSRLSERNICLDGIRGIAVALVIVHHAFYGAHPSNHFTTVLTRIAGSGWIGVDLFFVLSGFLITGILLRSRESRGYFRIFYMRRFFRIFPLYYGCLLAALLVSALVRPDGIGRLDLSWNLFYLANFRLALHGWAWRPVSHLWSLSVEEQFYLIWPTVILFLPRRTTFAAILGLFAIFVGARQGFASVVTGHQNLVFGVLHLDGLLLGAALAALSPSQQASARARTAAWTAFLFCGAALLAVGLYQGSLNWRIWDGVGLLNYSLVAAFGVALIAVSVYSSPHTQFNRVLALRPLVEMGKYSYAIYILHYPLDTAFRALHLHPTSVYGTIAYTVLLGCVSFAAALATWKLVEERCIRLKDRLYSYDSAPRKTARAATADQVPGGFR